MDQAKRSITILMAEDDPDDQLLAERALSAARLRNDFRTVKDGVELMDYLRRRGSYAPPASSPWPGLILLDLNMPKKDGRQCLQEIKSDPDLRSIPIVVLTTSKSEEDILRSYNLGANSYIRKPVTFESLVTIIKILGQYWFDIVELPHQWN